MERKEFLQHACGLGLCSCAVAALFASVSQAADETAPAEAKPEDGRLKFARQRYATLIQALAARTDAATAQAILEDVGRACASELPALKSFAGNLDGFLDDMRQRWPVTIQHDREKGTVDLAFPPADDCFCPLLTKAMSPQLACNCSIGWQKQAFETAMGRPVTVTITESVLRGGARCAFHVQAA